MPIAFITLRMVFALAWTIGDANSLSCQPLYQAHFVCRSSTVIIVPPWLNNVVRYGTTEKVEHALNIDFLCLPLRSSAPFLVCMELFSKTGF
jgi:hypothetical protein